MRGPDCQMNLKELYHVMIFGNLKIHSFLVKRAFTLMDVHVVVFKNNFYRVLLVIGTAIEL